MNKKTIDDLLYMAGEQMEIDSLGEPCAYHHFSDDYDKRKGQLREKVRQAEGVKKATASGGPKKLHTKKRFSLRRWSVVAAAAVLVCAMSLMAYAYYRNLQMDVSQNKNTVSINIKEKAETASEQSQTVSNENGAGALDASKISTDGAFSRFKDLPDEGIEIPYVSISLSYIPDGYAPEEGQGAGRYSLGGKYAAEGFWVLQNTQRSSQIYFTEDYETAKIGDMEAIITKPQITGTDATYSAHIYLLNPTDMVFIEVGTRNSSIEPAELMKIAEGLTYESTGETTMAYAQTIIEKFELSEEDRTLQKTQLVQQFDIDQSNVYNENQDKALIKISGITLADDIHDLDRNNFSEQETLDRALTADGTFKDERILGSFSENDRTAVREPADTKLMLITFEITNTGSSDMQKYLLNSLRTATLEDRGDTLRYIPRNYYYDELGYGDWCYLDGSDYTQNQEDRVHSFFAIDIPQGQTLTVTMGRMVYADELDHLYLCYTTNPGMEFNADYNDTYQLIYLKDFISNN